MGRRHTAGAVGNQGVGGVQVDNTTLTAADNLDITVDASGTGRFIIASDAQIQAQGDLRFADSDSSNWVAFQAPATVAANVTWTLPDADGTTGQFLSTNASGTLSWASGGLAVSDNNSDSATNYLAFTTTTSGTATVLRIATSTRPLTYQPSTGTLSTTLFNETSSIALKENLTPIENALEKIIGLQGYLYDRRDGSRKNEPGLIAEDVEQIIPEVVTKDQDGKPESIAYQRLVTYLIESVKEISKELEILKGR
jgi:hypothetical protein